VALSARGDWILMGKDDPRSDSARRMLFKIANQLEWLYRSVEENPYKKRPEPNEKQKPPKPAVKPKQVEKTPPPSQKWTAWPQPTDLHPLVVNMPPEAETSIASVAKYIAEHESDSMGRWKAMHDWVADRIAYDGPALKLPEVPREDAEADEVFRTRKAVCAGYADLIVKLAEAMGETAYYVTGHVRSKSSTLDGVGHAWNLVKVKDSWYLLDATWDAGHLDGDAFKKSYSTTYLFTPPEVFGLDHFPDEEWEQLRYPALTQGEFLRLPNLRPEFFARGLELVSPDRSQVTVPSALDLQLKNPSGKRIWLRYTDVGSDNDRECSRPDSGERLHCDLPGRGTYDVRLYVEGATASRYEYVGKIEVNVHS
jgi:transglutaminase/protease-like cytokinesis protein 3